MTNKLAIPARKNSRSTLPPLEITERVETHEKSGEKIKITDFRRGAARMRCWTYTGLGALEPDPPARTILEDHQERIRDRLQALGLPSDRNPFWKQLDDGSWVEVSDPKDTGNIGATWFGRVENLTEPLTEGRALAYHLESLKILLSSTFDDKALRQVLDCMQTRVDLTLWGPLNELAAAGLTAKKSRAAGPAAKKAISERKRQLAYEVTRGFWNENPDLMGDASNTAAHILQSVNAKLEAMKLLPLKLKTLVDYIREGLHNNLI
jgi:hypothetical protein